jgi:hypothetical protein
MNKLNLLFAFCILLLNFAHAQTPPNAFNYSAVARNAAGQPIASAKIGIQISILKTSTTGAVQYSENHIVNTDAFGLFNLAIGTGTVQSGSMSSINWGTDNYYIKVGMDVSGGSNFLTMGTTQLMSVPYSLHSKNASNGIDHISNDTDTLYLSNGKFFVAGSKASTSNTVGKTYIELFGDITNAQADSTLKADLGPNTQFVYITNTTKLTSVDLSSITALMELSITGNEVLTSVNASSLTRCTKYFGVSTNPILATIQTDKITFLGAVDINSNAKLTALNFPVLSALSKNLSISTNASLTLFTAPLLTSCWNININNNGLSNLSFPALTTIRSELLINHNALLNTLNISSLSKIPTFFQANNNKLSNIIWAPQINSWNDIKLQSNALPSSEINKILALFVAAGKNGHIGNGLFQLNSQTPLAPPTGQGITDKATIQGWGVSVSTD